MGNTCIGGISWNTNPKELLQADDITELAAKFSSGDISQIEANIINKINAEKTNGLSIDAFNVDGRAPYNEIAIEVSSRMANSNAKVEQARDALLKSGQEHRIKEANELWKAVTDQHKKRYEILETAKNEYNNYDWCEIKAETDEYTNQTTTKKVHKSFPKISLTSYADAGCADVVGHLTDGHPKKGEFEHALSDYKNFFNEYVKRALDYKLECKSGVQSRYVENAKMVEANNLGSGLKQTYDATAKSLKTAHEDYNYVPSTDGAEIDRKALEGTNPLKEIKETYDAGVESLNNAYKAGVESLNNAHDGHNYAPSADGLDIDQKPLEGANPLQELATAVDEVTVDEAKVNTEEIYNIPMV